jgi:hypothetical protein
VITPSGGPAVVARGADGGAARQRALLVAAYGVLALFEGTLLLRLAWELAAHALGHTVPFPHNDFLAFYSAAHFVAEGQIARAYDSTALVAFQRLLVSHPVGAMGYMPFLNPPFAAVLQAPLAMLSEPVARILWFAANALLALVVARSLTSTMSGKTRVVASLIVLGSFPVYQTLIEGQWSLVILAGCLLGYHFADRGRQTEAGLCLSVLWLKPQLAVIAILGLLVFRCWRPMVAMVAAVSVLTLFTMPWTGVHSYAVYVQFLSAASQDHFVGASALHPAAWRGAISLTEGLNGMFAAWFGESAVRRVNLLYALAAGATLLVYARAARTARPGIGTVRGEVMLLASITVALLINPHLFPQDVILVFLCMPLVARRLANPLPVLIAACLLIDSTALDPFVPLHIYTLVLWCLTIFACLAIARAPRDGESGLYLGFLRSAGA